jgi:hypothetical protein
VFDTFGRTSGALSSEEWHQAWCNGTIESVQSGGSTSVALKVVVKAIPIGLSVDDARTFQRLYQSQNCGQNAGGRVDWEHEAVVSRVASPSLVAAYVQCREIEGKGLQTAFEVRQEDQKTFSASVKFVQSVPGVTSVRITSVTFQPNVVQCAGDLRADTPLRNLEARTIACERTADVPLTMVIGTNIGQIRRDLRGFYPPPTDTERIMGALPRGTILPWYGQSVPVGWQVCDGTQGTPNLVDRYPFGTADVTAIGTTLGTDSHAHSLSGQTPAGGGLGRSGRDNRYLSEGGHTHDLRATPVSSSSNMPPSTRVRFIMKL